MAKPAATKAKAKPKTSDAIEALRKDLAAIDAADVHAPPIPVKHLLEEAEVLAKAADKHLPKLVAVGLDSRLVSGLGKRIHALADAQAAMLFARGSTRSDDELALEREGVHLRSDMVADGRFALRADASAQAQLSAIQAGEGLDDLVQDLRELAAFFGANEAALKAVGAKPRAKAKRAAAIAEGLAASVAKRRSADAGGAKELRDRAATLLVRAMTEIRAAGVYALRGDPKQVGKFRSAYSIARNSRSAKARNKADGAAAKTPTA